MWESSTEKDQCGFYKIARRYLGKPQTRHTYPIRKRDGNFASTDSERVQVFTEVYQDIYSCPQSHDGYEDLNKEAERYAKALRSTYSGVQERESHDIQDPINYRPITCCRPFEKLINIELVKWLEDKSIIPESQSGFRANRSTQDQLFLLSQDVSHAL